MTIISKKWAFSYILLHFLAVQASNQENLSATKDFIKHLVSLEQMNLKKKGNTNIYTPSSRMNDQDYTETNYANGKTEIVQSLSAHHFGEDAYTKCSRYRGDSNTFTRYYCTANMPTEELVQLKREADEQRLAKIVDRMSPQTLTVLKHAFATGEYKLQRRHGDTDTSKTIAVDMQTSGLHPEVEKIRQQVLRDSIYGGHQSLYSFLRRLRTGHAAYFIEFDEYSSSPAESEFIRARSLIKVKGYSNSYDIDLFGFRRKYGQMNDFELVRHLGHKQELWPDFTYTIKNLNIHEDNIDLLKKAVEAKVGKAEYPAKPVEEKQKATVLGAALYSSLNS